MNESETYYLSSTSPIKQGIGFLFLLLLFVIPACALPKVNTSSFSIPIMGGGLTLQSSSLCGILSSLQIVSLICMVVFFEKIGLWTALACGILSIGSSIIPIIRLHNLNSVAGIILNVIALTMCIIIYNANKTLNRQNKRLEAYNHSLAEKQESLHRLAYYDYLTDLPNRRNIVEVISSLCEHSDERPFQLVVVDINNFKKINDVAGLQKGDALLKQLVSSWKILLHPDDLLGRIDGDEFAILIPRVLSEADFNNYINGFRNSICTQLPFIGGLPTENGLTCETQGILLSANFGVVSCPEHGTNPEEILQFANTALAVSKETGPNTIRYFNQSMYDSLLKKTILESALSGSLNNEECYLMFQPQYTANKKTLRGFETLVRWENKDLGFIPPSLFIPLAEETGFILPLGEWILSTALTEFSKLLTLYPTDLILCVNLSVIQILHPGFMDMVKRVLKETGFDPYHLEFEITESIFISDKEEVITILNQVKELGITIALDDFGTSYSSLTYIKELPLDLLKIDKAFVDAILEDTKKAQLVDTILAIAKQMDYKVVAEGIETKKQLSYLKDRSCDYIQGFLWGKPLQIEQVTALLEEHRKMIS